MLPSDLENSLREAWAGELGTATMKTLIGQAKVLDCETGHVIFRRGDASDGFYTVLSGQVRFSRDSEMGLELLLAILGPGSTFGDLASVSGRPRSHRAVCDMPCQLWHISLANFRSLMSTHADFGALIVERMAQRSHELFDMIEDQMLLGVPSRLARRLVALARSVNGNRPLPAVMTIRVTQDDLAKLIGASRQSVSAHLLAWQKQGLIQQAYGNIQILDLAGLQAVSRGE